MAAELGIGEITLRDIVKELEKPARDPRDDKMCIRDRDKAMQMLKAKLYLLKQQEAEEKPVSYTHLLSRMLKRQGIKHNVLNAKFHELEAEIVSQACLLYTSWS